ncbi:DEAD/DEAH box helicase [Paenibacillus psychroresistens]|uniref:DEAD/DEAH box helicase n=1 Tax=Paenibacillus psychroresistens TaxID=1778678 RepID=UPI001D05400C|nr:DEAD/DEAH box helicase [Paenibacillus psychroresistens]
MDDSTYIFQEELYNRFVDNAGDTLLFLGFAERALSTSDSLLFLKKIAAAFIKKLTESPDLELMRDHVKVELEADESQQLLDSVPYLFGAEHLNEDWIKQVWTKLTHAFSAIIRNYEGTVEQYLSSMNPNVHLVGRVFFHLVESKKEEFPFAYMATYAAEVSQEGKSKHLPLKNALVEYGKNSKKLLELLSTVNRASERSDFIAELVESGEIFHPIGLSADEAFTFLKEIPLYEEAGILCRIPKWWKQRSSGFKLAVSVGEKPPSHLDFAALVDFNAELFLAGEAIQASEIRKLLSEAEGLSFIKGKWIEVNHARLQETLKAYEQAQKLMNNSELSMVDALRFQLNAAEVLNIPEENLALEVTNGDWLHSVIERLTHPDTIEAIDCGEDFHASLRVYQERGLSWLHYMKSLGLGACLADDMGLGKTVQVIALLNYIRSQKNEKTLLVVPASLIGNWLGEIQKFAPSLRVYVIHPSENKNLNELDSSILQGNELFITTYGMLLKYDWLVQNQWDCLILDEAQAIKNPGSKQTKLVKQVKAAYKIAMTGTPIENRLSDLWSLFDFLNKGLLGSAKEFTSFTKRLRENQDGYTRLKQVVSPFILRRLKTDKSVISDLPEKIEMKSYATLTKKQVILYNKLVNELRDKLESTDEGIERKGLVLASLMKFKQICNHPDQYLGQHFYAEEESGKYARLREICEMIYEKRERVLIFTQFKEITEPLKDFLETVFQHKGLVLHGGTAVHKRQELVAKFQGQEYVPFMVLSIKAGGVGLNLTSANHVIHFDRWWNPAVENQATDRAFRIGQMKNVIVHKFITKGTIEEKIDLIIEDKNKLSQEIIPELQENWITEMDNKQLMGLFKLS